MKRQFLILPIIIFSAVLCSGFLGDGVKIKNLSPKVFSENPSGTYSLRMSVNTSMFSLVRGILSAYIVIDGNIYPMTRIDKEGRKIIFEYDYKLPKGQNQARYYYKVESDESDTLTRSDLYDLKVSNRYVLGLDFNRGLVGSELAVMGRSFLPSDRVVVNGVPAKSNYKSPNVIKFTVPPLPADKSYPVVVISRLGNLKAGTFKVDAQELKVYPERIYLAPEESLTLTLEINQVVPFGMVISCGSAYRYSRKYRDARGCFPFRLKSYSSLCKRRVSGSGKIIFKGAGLKEVEVSLVVVDPNATELPESFQEASQMDTYESPANEPMDTVDEKTLLKSIEIFQE